MDMFYQKKNGSKRRIVIFFLFMVGFLGIYSCGDENTNSGSGTFDSTWSVTVQPAFTTLKASTANSTLVVVTVKDKNGNPPDTQLANSITTVYFSTNLGTINSSVTLDASGHAVATYVAAVTPGTATVKASYQGSLGSATITLISSSI